MQMTPRYTYRYLQQTLIFPLKQLGNCLSDISGWMTNNKLRLNANKTDFIIIAKSRQRSKLYIILVLHLITNLISENFSLTCRSCFYHIRDLRRIRRYISLSVANIIATALITSRLDYCNIASKDILKLQCVQNCLGMVIT